LEGEASGNIGDILQELLQTTELEEIRACMKLGEPDRKVCERRDNGAVVARSPPKAPASKEPDGAPHPDCREVTALGGLV
jgi:hypothetical protein